MSSLPWSKLFKEFWNKLVNWPPNVCSACWKVL